VNLLNTIKKISIIILYFVLRFCIGRPMIVVYRPKHVAMFK